MSVHWSGAWPVKSSIVECHIKNTKTNTKQLLVEDCLGSNAISTAVILSRLPNFACLSVLVCELMITVSVSMDFSTSNELIKVEVPVPVT